MKIKPIQTIFNKASSFLSVIVLAIFLSAGISYAAWIEPSATPPGNNTPAPINVGPTWQSKSNGIDVTGLAVFGNASFSGNILFGNNGWNSLVNKGGGINIIVKDATKAVVYSENAAGTSALQRGGDQSRTTGTGNDVVLETYGSQNIQGTLYANRICLNGSCITSWPSNPTVVLCLNNSWGCSNKIGAAREIVADSVQNVYDYNVARTNASQACYQNGYDYLGFTYFESQTSCGKWWNGVTWNGSSYVWVTRSCGTPVKLINSIYCKQKPVSLPSNIIN